jgi:hypothetical protein
LDQSWANIAEYDNTEQRALDEMDAVDLPEAHNKHAYATRGKTGHAKTSK